MDVLLTFYRTTMDVIPTFYRTAMDVIPRFYRTTMCVIRHLSHKVTNIHLGEAEVDIMLLNGINVIHIHTAPDPQNVGKI